MQFDTKIAIVVQADLAAWQKLNVTAFLASAVAGGAPEVIGEPYADGSGNAYLPMFRQPVLVYAADAAALGRGPRPLALGRGLATARLHRGDVQDRPRRGQPGRGRPSPPTTCRWSAWPSTGRGTPWTRS